MIRRLMGAALACVLAGQVAAQDFTGLARVDMDASAVTDLRFGIEVDLELSQPVPWRVFTLDDPMRLVVDFREIDWRGVTQEGLQKSTRVTDLRFGSLRPGWSRMIVDLKEPLAVDTAGMAVDPVTNAADLTIRLAPTTEAEFKASAGAPPDPGWDMMAGVDLKAELPAIDDGLLTVAIDPGHGGIDPGAERGGLQEANVMLRLGREVAETINRQAGMKAVLTRDEDVFVPLEERMTIARAAGADVFISLHADALEGDDVTSGASIYTLSDDAESEASQRMAERHDRSDLVTGLDLSGHDDTIATVLMDMARVETAPKTETLADTLIRSLSNTGASVNSRPHRKAYLAVLNAADFPSVLIEVGFLSNAGDRSTLETPEGRARIVAGIVLGLQRWADAEEARAPLMRQ